MALFKAQTELIKSEDSNTYYIKNQNWRAVGLVFLWLTIIYFVMFILLYYNVYLNDHANWSWSILWYINYILTWEDMIFLYYILASLFFGALWYGFTKAKTYIDLESKQIYAKILGIKANVVNFEDIIDLDLIWQAYSNNLYKLNIVKKWWVRELFTSSLNRTQATNMINQIFWLMKNVWVTPKETSTNEIWNKVARFRLVGDKFVAGFIYDSRGNLLRRYILFFAIIWVIVYLFVYQNKLLFSCDPREAFDWFTCYMIWYALPLIALINIYFSFKIQVFDLKDRIHYKSFFGLKRDKVRFSDIYRYNVVLNYHNGIYNGTSIFLTHNKWVTEVSLWGDAQEYAFVNFIKTNILTNDRNK